MVPFNRSGGRCRRRQKPAAPDFPLSAAAKEPVMRRYARPPAAEPAASLETVQAELHSLGCALERQNRLLLDLQSLLQRLAPQA